MISLFFINCTIIYLYLIFLGDNVTHFLPRFIKFLSIWIDTGAGSSRATKITDAPWSAKYIPQKTEGARP